MELKNKVAIVTGSSKGLGLVLVEQLLAEGVIVIGFSRTETPVDHPNFKAFQVDMSKEDQIVSSFNEVIKKQGTIDIIINNAGFGSYHSLEHTSSIVMRQMFETNVFGIFYLVKCAIPYMKKAKHGHIINISSIAGIVGIENMSVYNGTKFAVKGISESLYKELRPHGIKVTCILPGSISTNFFDDFEGFTPSNTMMHPKDVSDSIVYCLKSSASFHPVNLEIRPFHPLSKN